jgi:sodium/pantothenate symporter
VPVLFGTFLDDVPLSAVATASVVALLVHYGLYYTGHHYFPYYMDVTTKNPGIATALGVVAATVVGGLVYLVAKSRRPATSTTA